MSKRFRFSIDRGGTFTDVFCEVVEANGTVKPRVVKLLSEDPSNYKDAPTEGIRRIMEDELGILMPRGVPIQTETIEFIRMGTTVATNALLERKGEKTALLTTAGFEDLQRIGNQSRPKIFDLEIKRAEQLYSVVIGVKERVILVKDHNEHLYPSEQILIGKSKEKIFIEEPLNATEIESKLQEILSQGIKSIAVVLLHSYTYPYHEQLIQQIAIRLGFEQISLSSEVMPMIRVIPRGGTTCVDAYLTPVIKRYLVSFAQGFMNQLQQVNVGFMQSDGGLTPMECFYGNRAILSGPAGGVVGYAVTSLAHHQTHYPQDGASGTATGTSFAVIGFDMGGTSTDVSRFAGSYEHVFETTTAGVSIQSPQLDINTVAAGGGSRLFFRNGLFIVGPESAGAHPGPVSYRKNGYLTITDANVVLGKIQPHLFPAIFGIHENERLDLEGAYNAFTKLTEEVNDYFAQQSQSSSSSSLSSITPKVYTVDEVAHGFIRVANEAMARPIRNLTTMKGYDVTKHWLGCFGGAGPQHCCAIAKSLGMKKVFVHRYSGILSAYGLALADVVVERQEPYNSSILDEMINLPFLQSRLQELAQEAMMELIRQGFSLENITVQHYLNCRYQGTDTAAMTCLDSNHSDQSYREVFINNYRREYGFELTNRPILVDDLRVRAIGHTTTTVTNNTSSITSSVVSSSTTATIIPPPIPQEHVLVYFENGRVSTPVYLLSNMLPKQQIYGPAIIMQEVATVVIEPGCTALISMTGDIEITIEEELKKNLSIDIDPIYLSVFSHRFMGIAEQMGRTLQRTSISVNIKERLDFSCALFDAEGGLVANAPHLPVHLGAMSEAVRYQKRYWNGSSQERSLLQEGDVVVSNHPQLAGGSHLPDITVMTPIFWYNQ
jgi:5-oxoprolinase (ATP-hydrolysing)